VDTEASRSANRGDLDSTCRWLRPSCAALPKSDCSNSGRSRRPTPDPGVELAMLYWYTDPELSADARQLVAKVTQGPMTSWAQWP
jgi:hypothetical protein